MYLNQPYNASHKNNPLTNDESKKANKCGNILKSELDNVMNRYVPRQKRGKWSKKKHLGEILVKCPNGCNAD